MHYITFIYTRPSTKTFYRKYLAVLRSTKNTTQALVGKRGRTYSCAESTINFTLHQVLKCKSHQALTLPAAVLLMELPQHTWAAERRVFHHLLTVSMAQSTTLSQAWFKA